MPEIARQIMPREQSQDDSDYARADGWSENGDLRILLVGVKGEAIHKVTQVRNGRH
jgi:hypothetical protein